jgi:hypothetical protein
LSAIDYSFIQRQYLETLTVTERWVCLAFDETERATRDWHQIWSHVFTTLATGSSAPEPVHRASNLPAGLPEWLHDATTLALAQAATMQGEFAALCERTLEFQRYYQQRLNQSVAESVVAGGKGLAVGLEHPAARASDSSTTTASSDSARYQSFIRDYGSTLDEAWRLSLAAMLNGRATALMPQWRQQSGNDRVAA